MHIDSKVHGIIDGWDKAEPLWKGFSNGKSKGLKKDHTAAYEAYCLTARMHNDRLIEKKKRIVFSSGQHFLLMFVTQLPRRRITPQ